MFSKSVPFLCAALAFGTTAAAQSGPAEVARRDLLRDADVARTAGDHARALDLATRAGQIRMTTSLRLLLAQEHEATGHLVDALDHASGCAREAEADATMRNRQQVQGICQALVASITPRVGNLVVQVSSPPPGLVVRVAGHEVNPALYGVAFPVMPGSVAVEVGGEGVVASREEVQVRAGARVEVSPRVQVRVVEAAATGAGAGGVDARVAPVQPPVVERSSGPGAGPWVLVGIGGAAAVAGGVMFYLADQARIDRNEADRLNQEGRAVEANESFRTNALIGNVLMGAAIACGVSGVVWAVAGRGRSNAQVALMPMSGGAMLGVGGAL
jgi:hypothetical protein